LEFGHILIQVEFGSFMGLFLEHEWVDCGAGLKGRDVGG